MNHRHASALNVRNQQIDEFHLISFLPNFITSTVPSLDEVTTKASIPHQSTKTPSRASLTDTTSNKMVTTMISTSTENVSTVSQQTENKRSR